MSSKAKITKRLGSVFFAVLLLLSILTMAVTSVSAEANEDVKKDASGVFYIKAGFSNVVGKVAFESGNAINCDHDILTVQGGSAFLINDTTILTCYHVINVEENRAALKSQGVTHDKDPYYELTVNKDVTIRCTLINGSARDDYAILQLSQSLGGSYCLPLDVSKSAQPTDTVYSLGFPGIVDDVEVMHNLTNIAYDKEDITITEGIIQKINKLDNTDVIQHGSDIHYGNSGGPLVNKYGAVIGINKWVTPTTTAGAAYNYATAINEAIKVLDSLQIEYTPWNGGTVPTTTREQETTVQPTTENPQPTTINPTNPVTDPTKGGGGSDGFDPKIIIIIAIAVVVVAIIIVVIAFLVSNKKKSAAKMNPPQNGGTVIQGPGPNRQVPPTASQPNMRGPGYVPDNRTAYNNEGAGETSVLNDGAGETTVLGGQSAGFKLLRKRNNEQIKVNKSEFLIGKERRRVDYCISDNNSISRIHARFTVRGGRCYISDLGSTNCTYVNGNKLTPNQEVVLSAGDTIKISDEEFSFMG